jgi:predicted adenine nucleotide alpha hydrolase (AANH) superfamily ATPase
VPTLRDLGHEVSLFYANSNIDTKEEFDLRFENVNRLAEAEGVAVFSSPYDHEAWLREVASGYENEPEKGSRCARCFRFNLAQTAKYAKEHGFDAFTSSLTISPHKVSAMVFSAGNDVSEPCAFLEIDFKKKNGYLKSLQRTKELGLSRQSYCGCEFSISK